MSWKAALGWAKESLEWAKENPHWLVVGTGSLVVGVAIFQVLNVGPLRKIEHQEPIGKAPAARSLSPEELAKSENPLLGQQQDVAINTLTDTLSRFRGNTLAYRCARWRKAYLDLEAPKGVSLQRFVASKLKEQSDLLMVVEPGDFSGQLLRQGEMDALRLLWSDCKPLSFQVVTPAGLDSIRNRAGSVAVAASRLELESIKVEASLDETRDAAAAAARKATAASATEEPVLEPLGGASQ